MSLHHRCMLSSMLLLFLACSCDGIFDLKKVNVNISNELGSGMYLNLQCKSKNDDLGPQLLAPQQYFTFHFHNSLFRNTLFFCRFWWGNESHWFDIYIQKRKLEEDICKRRCWWQIQGPGPCLLDPDTGSYRICFGWNKAQLEGMRGNDSNYLEAIQKMEY